MGEELSAEGRAAVRTPMQWTSGRNGGFSSARPSRLPGPVVMGGFGPEFVNVQDQRLDHGSLLSFVRHLIRRYHEAPELGWGELEILDQPERPVLVHLVRQDADATLAVHNLGPEPATLELEVPEVSAGCVLRDRLQDHVIELDDRGRAELPVDGYGYHWFRVSEPGDPRLA